MTITEEDLARIWGAPELVPTYVPGGDPEDGRAWQMEQTVENFIRNPLAAMAWPREVRIRLVREVQGLRPAAAPTAGDDAALIRMVRAQLRRHRALSGRHEDDHGGVYLTGRQLGRLADLADEALTTRATLAARRAGGRGETS